MAEDFVGILVEFYCPWAAVFFNKFFKDGFETAGVGDRAVEQPSDPAGADLVNSRCRQFNSRQRLADFPPGTVQSGQIADTAVSADKQIGASQSRLKGDQNIVPIHQKDSACRLGWLDLGLSAAG